ncbi:DUF1307 domain-containing protein [Lacticaseibacillus jixianensis]|uniref:DUF1307 domain-containing protein n=1 Tax=Lacticaseibacillus jixianensis TaxID=2486012 RepID=A0ABW4B5Z7_9LACO|nr:DUF1307 domain-containing protein [Lacticaseibacillus jixianensis]
MKRILKALVAAVAVLSLTVLAGCTLFEQKTTLVNTQVAGAKATMIYYTKHNSDKVLQQKLINENDMVKLLGTKKKTIMDAAYKEMKKSVNSYKNLKGVTTKVSRNGNTVTQEVLIDYTKVDMKKLKKAQGLDASTRNTVSLKDSVSTLKAAGFKKQ